MIARFRFLFVTAAAAVLIVLMLSPIYAESIPLQNATADKEQAGGELLVWKTIDGVYVGWQPGDLVCNGWGCEDSPGVTSPRTAVWETQTDASFSTWTFKLHQSLSFGPNTEDYTLQKVRISYTTDDRDTFADGLGVGGDIDANWTEMTPTLAFANLSTATINADNTVSWTDPNDPDVYTIVVQEELSGVTGFRLEALAGDNGKVGWWPADGNAVLVEFEAEGVPEPSIPVMLLLLSIAVATMLRRR